MNKIRLPKAIEVKVVREKSGVLFAELPKYSIFTEADSFSDLVFNVNDLVQSFFDVPKKLRVDVWYNPPEELVARFQKLESKKNAPKYKNKAVETKIDPVLFSVLTSSSSNNFLFK